MQAAAVAEAELCLARSRAVALEAKRVLALVRRDNQRDLVAAVEAAGRVHERREALDPHRVRGRAAGSPPRRAAHARLRQAGPYDPTRSERPAGILVTDCYLVGPVAERAARGSRAAPGQVRRRRGDPGADSLPAREPAAPRVDAQAEQRAGRGVRPYSQRVVDAVAVRAEDGAVERDPQRRRLPRRRSRDGREEHDRRGERPDAVVPTADVSTGHFRRLREQSPRSLKRRRKRRLVTAKEPGSARAVARGTRRSCGQARRPGRRAAPTRAASAPCPRSGSASRRRCSAAA